MGGRGLGPEVPHSSRKNEAQHQGGGQPLLQAPGSHQVEGRVLQLCARGMITVWAWGIADVVWGSQVSLGGAGWLQARMQRGSGKSAALGRAEEEGGWPGEHGGWRSHAKSMLCLCSLYPTTT